MGSWVLTSYLVSRMPLTNEAEPVTVLAPVAGFVSDAVQVLLTTSAMNGPGPTPPGGSCAGEKRVMAVLQVTDPRGPVVPLQPTVMGPDGGAAGWLSGQMPPKMTAGPYEALAPSGSDWETDPPAGGRVTEGLDEAAALAAGTQPGGTLVAVQICWPNPRSIDGPPKRLTSVR